MSADRCRKDMSKDRSVAKCVTVRHITLVGPRRRPSLGICACFCHTLQNYVSLTTRWQCITLKWDGTLLYVYLYATEKGSNFSELYKCSDTPFGPQFANLHLLLIFCTLLQVIFLGEKNRIVILE